MTEPAPFAIGTSSSVAAPSTAVDMSLGKLGLSAFFYSTPVLFPSDANNDNNITHLKIIYTDDLIANRRKTNPPRAVKKNAAAARATGQNKARRGARVAARRGIANTAKPAAVEEERQVNRARRTTAALRNGRGSGVGRAGVGGGRGARGTAPRASDVKAKAKARLNKARSVIAQQKAAKGGKNSGGVAAPTQKAVSVAAKAMKDFGFKAPKGMQMQISFVPKKGTPAGTGGNNGGRNGGRNAGRGGNNNNTGGRGGRGRGRR